MKNIFTTLILFCLFTYNGFTQTTIQATIFDAGANTVQLYGNPNVNVADSLFNQIKICLSIADMGVLNPSWSDIIVNSQIPSLDVYVDNSNPYIIGGRAFYQFILNGNSDPTTINWTAGTDNPIATFQFPLTSPINTLSMRMYDIPGGANTANMNWFIESAGLSNVTNIPTMFYGIGAVNTGGTDSSYVPLQSAGILAVKFSDFSVTTRNDNALLNWIVEEESTSTDRYEVERSTDGKYFSSFSTISVSNSYGKRAAYTYNDNNISALSNSGSIYYRVKQIDKDGQSVNSSVQKITISAKDISVMPNPVKNIAYVTYSLSESTPVFISVLNSIGTELQQFELQGFIGVNNQKIDMGAYPAGAYLLKIRTGNQVKTFTIMKVN